MLLANKLRQKIGEQTGTKLLVANFGEQTIASNKIAREIRKQFCSLQTLIFSTLFDISILLFCWKWNFPHVRPLDCWWSVFPYFLKVTLQCFHRNSFITRENFLKAF